MSTYHNEGEVGIWNMVRSEEHCVYAFRCLALHGCIQWRWCSLLYIYIHEGIHIQNKGRHRRRRSLHVMQSFVSYFLSSNQDLFIGPSYFPSFYSFSF